MTHYILVDADERAGPQQGHARDGPKIHIDRIGVHVFKIANAGPDEGGLLPLVVGLRPVLSLLPLLATIHIIFPSFILLVLSEPWFLRLWPVALIGRAGTGMMNGSRCGRRWRRHYLDTQSLKPEQERGLVREGGHAFLFPVYHTLGHVVDGVDVPDIHDLPVVLASVSSILDTVLSLHPPPLSSTCSIRSRYHGSDQDVLITRQLFSAAILRRRQQPRRLAALGNARQRSAVVLTRFAPRARCNLGTPLSPVTTSVASSGSSTLSPPSASMRSYTSLKSNFPGTTNSVTSARRGGIVSSPSGMERSPRPPNSLRSEDS